MGACVANNTDIKNNQGKTSLIKGIVTGVSNLRQNLKTIISGTQEKKTGKTCFFFWW